MLALNQKDKKSLIAKAHHLKPVVLLGHKGLTEPVLVEVDRALEHHELIKVKIPADTKEERKACAVEIAQNLHAEFLHLVGYSAILYRKSKDSAK